MNESTNPYVSRGGLKLAAALEAFGLDVTGWICADLGCNVGGFTDCLLQRGAAKVFAIDTGYGELAWTLRNDERVVVMERTNAMHSDAVQSPIDLAVIDMGWTRQKHAIPAAMRWKPKHIIALIKPHYECEEKLPKGAILDEAQAEQITERVLTEMPMLNVRVINTIRSPIRGGKAKGKTGNIEYLAMLAPEGAGGRREEGV